MKKRILIILAAVVLFSLLGGCAFRPKTESGVSAPPLAAEPTPTPQPELTYYNVTYRLDGETIGAERVAEGTNPQQVPAMVGSRGVIGWNNVNGAQTNAWNVYITADTVSRAVELYAMVDGCRVEVEYVPLARAEYLAMKASGDAMQSTFTVKDAHGSPVEAGMEVVLFLVTDRVDDTLILPANAVRRDTTGYYVYRVTDEGQKRQSVTRGLFTDALVEIAQGLEEGEQVYVGT